jgi:Bacterial regulatory proteins, luxR family
MAPVQMAVPEGRTLTARERQVLTMLSEGRTRKEVAYALGIAHATVRVLYARAMKKVERRTAGISFSRADGPSLELEPIVQRREPPIIDGAVEYCRKSPKRLEIPRCSHRAGRDRDPALGLIASTRVTSRTGKASRSYETIAHGRPHTCGLTLPWRAIGSLVLLPPVPHV